MSLYGLARIHSRTRSQGLGFLFVKDVYAYGYLASRFIVVYASLLSCCLDVLLPYITNVLKIVPQLHAQHLLLPSSIHLFAQSHGTSCRRRSMPSLAP